VAGERRYRAAQQLGLTTLPCRVRNYENTTAAVVALAENVHRQDLSELEKAEALLRIKTLTERTWEQLAELVKLSPDYVKRLVGLLKLADPVKQLLRDGQISARVAIALKPLPPRQQIRMAERAVQEDLSAEQIREEAQRLRTPRSAPSPPKLATVEGLGTRREGTVVRVLRDCKTAVGEIDRWVGERHWTPAAVPRHQRDELAELHEKVSQLHQQLAQITRALKDAEQDPLEKLRSATVLITVLVALYAGAVFGPFG
jgi:ParB/RepB/Spo0J family partition protein